MIQKTLSTKYRSGSLPALLRTIQSENQELLARLTQERKRRDFSKYSIDPAAYAHDILKVKLTSQQEEVCRALIQYKWILVPSANETGKSFLQAVLANWHYDTQNPGYTIITGPVHDQIQDTVWAELRTMRGDDPNFAPASMRLKHHEKHWVKGYTARSATAFQGRHEGSVFIIFEEAEDIDAAFWIAADSMAHYFAAFYNPISTTAETVIRERSDRYRVIRLSALDHPNVIAGLAGLPPPIPKAVTLERVIERLDKWATKLGPDDELLTSDVVVADVRYRPGPVAEARVLGRRPTTSVGSVFSTGLWDQMEAVRYEINRGWTPVVGVDTAHRGDDFTGLHGRIGLCSVHHESHNGLRTDAIVDRTKAVTLQLSPWTNPEHRAHVDYAKLIPIHIDDSPNGYGVQDSLLKQGYNVVPVNSASTNCSPEYPNIRSALWFGAKELAEKDMIDLSRIPPEKRELIRQQLLAPEYDLDTKGRRVVEPKKKTKSRTGRSPDDADAVLLCYYTPQVIREGTS
jgi:hypothetical protein